MGLLYHDIHSHWTPLGTICRGLYGIIPWYTIYWTSLGIICRLLHHKIPCVILWMEEFLHQLMVYPLFIGFQSSFWWCRISQPSTVLVVFHIIWYNTICWYLSYFIYNHMVLCRNIFADIDILMLLNNVINHPPVITINKLVVTSP